MRGVLFSPKNPLTDRGGGSISINNNQDLKADDYIDIYVENTRIFDSIFSGNVQYQGKNIGSFNQNSRRVISSGGDPERLTMNRINDNPESTWNVQDFYYEVIYRLVFNEDIVDA